MKFTYLGHSCFVLDTGSHRLLFDPFLTGNPSATVSADSIGCDFILVSHGHGDHFGDTLDIARRTGALIISNFEIAEHCTRLGCAAHGLYHGGGATFPFGRAKYTVAHHGSGLEGGPDGSFLYLGNPGGFVITSGGRNIYFAGDTAVFSDMQLIARMHPLDLAILPIGDNYTMGPDEALLALEFLRPSRAIPVHYNTWPPIAVDAADFARRAAINPGVQVDVLAPGASLDF